MSFRYSLMMRKSMIYIKIALMKYKIIIDNEVIFLEYAISNSWIFLLLKLTNTLTTLCIWKTILLKSYKF